jgi:hypothetical protein
MKEKLLNPETNKNILNLNDSFSEIKTDGDDFKKQLQKLDKDSIAGYVKKCFKKAGNFNTIIVNELEMMRLRKTTENNIRNAAYLTSSLQSVRSKNSVLTVDELDLKQSTSFNKEKHSSDSCPFEKIEANLSNMMIVDEELENEEQHNRSNSIKYLDNNYWHTEETKISDKELEDLLK